MTFENPYRHGAYHFSVAALLAMGVNKSHKFSAFVNKLRQIWRKADAEGWKAFEKRPARTPTGKDLEGRIVQNCRVIQRTKDYGKPLLAAGAVLDLTRDDKGAMLIRLNTKSKKPQKPGRAPKPEAKPAKSKAKTAREPSKRKKGAGKRSVKAGKPNVAEAAAEEAVKASVTDEAAKS